MNSMKKGAIIAALVEVVLCLYWIWLISTQGHSSLILGALFHFPGSIFGFLIGAALDALSSVVSLAALIGVSVLLQFIFLTMVFSTILDHRKKRRKKRT